MADDAADDKVVEGDRLVVIFPLSFAAQMAAATSLEEVGRSIFSEETFVNVLATNEIVGLNVVRLFLIV